jgi:mRNA-degrading endonuclease RelE of RelBE toxin-antitoxin system
MPGYRLLIEEALKARLKKLSKKNRPLYDAVLAKAKEILENPTRYKPLRHDLQGLRWVHLEKSFVLIYEVLYSRK